MSESKDHCVCRHGTDQTVESQRCLMQGLVRVLNLLAVAAFVGCLCGATVAAEAPSTTIAGLKSPDNPTPAQVKAFFGSAAYKAQQRSDADFLTDLYRVVLQREPDAPGYHSWSATLQKSPDDPKARDKALQAFLTAPEYLGKHSSATAVVAKKKDLTRHPANGLFNKTGVFVNSADAFPPDRYAPLMKKAGVVWLTLQIDNGGAIRNDNIASIGRGWAETWRAAGFKVGFWGAPRGVTHHNSEAAIAESTPLVQADAALAVKLTAQYHGEFYIADCEDGYQGYNQKDPTPALNGVYVAAFESAAKAAGLSKMPRALSSEGRVALDMRPWIAAGWDALPQAYWNAYAVYQPSKCVDFYVQEAGWPIGRIHPTIATFTSEGEKRTVSLQQYADDLKSRSTTGFSFYLPESYLGLTDVAAYEQLAKMAAH